MRTLDKVDEFRVEASGALFTKQQAIAITLRLLEMESENPSNTAEETQILQSALHKINFNYLDSTATQTDTMLDTLGVARLSADQIIAAIDNVIFEVK